MLQFFAFISIYYIDIYRNIYITSVNYGVGSFFTEDFPFEKTDTAGQICMQTDDSPSDKKCLDECRYQND